LTVATPTIIDDFEDLGGGALAELVLYLELFVREARITRFLIAYHMPLHGFNPHFQILQS
jgi:hypothetical protein